MGVWSTAGLSAYNGPVPARGAHAYGCTDAVGAKYTEAAAAVPNIEPRKAELFCSFAFLSESHSVI